jgi:16S rRNA (adenine1518-N6/adenine1519-N6)-dimethyltransferase
MGKLTDISYLKEIINDFDFNFSKSLGQNFLINPSVCPKIAEMGNAKKGFGIIEIGTGIGTLTVELASRAEKVLAIEIDNRLLSILGKTLKDYNNIKIINEDVMKVDLHKIIDDEFKNMDVAVCANLPYYLTSPIIMMLLESKLPIKSITVMVQKEAAQRICAKVGTRESGAITVAVNYYAETEKLFDVSRGSFMPSPNVDSSVIKITLRDNTHFLNEEDESFFFKIIKSAFSQRRKTIVNAVSSMMNIEKQKIINVLGELNIKATVRVEEMDMEALYTFSTALKKLF